MLTFHRHHHDHHAKVDPTDRDTAPWQSGHAAPEDQALGLELELIELVRQRSEAESESNRIVADRLDTEIDGVLHELAAVAATIRAA
ncbi:MAG: hypothetical protein ABIP03_05620 [Aquihabitans sp.]